MKFSIREFQREFLKIQKKNDIISATLTANLIASSVLDQMKIEHSVAKGYLSIENAIYLDHYWIISQQNYDFSRLPFSSVQYHLTAPKDQEYAIETQLEMVERDALVREWERVKNVPIAVGLLLHLDGMARMIGPDHKQAWRNTLADLNEYLKSNEFQAKVPKLPNVDA
jgi:hypothetical protein